MVKDQLTFFKWPQNKQIINPACHIFLCFCLSLFSVGSSTAQHTHCGSQVPTMEQINNLNSLAGSLSSKQRTSGALNYISIKPHVVRRADGTGGVSLKELNQTLASLNNTFRDLNVEFYFCSTGINYINNSKFYDFDNREEDLLARDNDVKHSINIYFLNSVQINGYDGSGGYAYFPGSESYTNRIFIVNEAARHGHMLAHEMGHYFGLVHTFERIGGMELVSRGDDGNCANAGDLICDTSADPYGMDGADWDDCNYIGTVRDLNGDFYSPPADNIMSYYNNCAERFSPGQFERMEVGALVRTSQSEYQLLAGEPAKVLPPANLTFSQNQNASISLQWEDVSDNETGFIIERSASLDEGYEAIAGLEPNSTFYVDNQVEEGVAYYYRVKPSNTTNSYSNALLFCSVIDSLEDIAGETQPCSGGYEYSVPFVEGLSYKWSITGGGSLTASENKAVVNWSAPGLQSISVSVSNACLPGPTKSTYIQVKDGDFAAVSDIEGSEEVCMGNQEYSALSIPDVDYIWSLSSGGTITGEGNSISILWDMPGNHTISLVPSNGCGEGEAITKRVKVLENPTVEEIGTIQTRNTIVCVGSFQYEVNYYNNVQYQWSATEGGSVNAEGAIATVDWRSPGLHTISLNIIKPCGESIVQNLQVRVMELPEKPVITVVNGKLTSNLSGEHQWFLNGEPIGGGIGPVCPSTLEGIYTVQQISACGQGPVSDSFILEKSLSNADQEHQIFIFPNPASSRVSIELPAELSWSEISILSAMGESVVSVDEKDAHGTTIRGQHYRRLINFDISYLARGIYMVKVKTSDGMISKRLLIN